MQRRSIKQVITDAFRLFISDIKNIKWALLLVFAYLVFMKKVVYSMCPFVVLTGYPCPGCGLTRAGLAVLHLDFASAWRIHPFIYPIIWIVMAYFINRYIRCKKNTNIFRWLVILVFAAMIGFYIFRIYFYFPGEPPMSYYRYNVANRLLTLLQSLK